jgi:hydroxymethylglutaryl-CoA lyase
MGRKNKSSVGGGCTRFDGALKGFGGCPMADDKLVGNMPTENMVLYFEEKGIDLGIDKEKFREAMLMAGQVFA